MVSLHCDPSGLRGAQGEAGNAPPPPPLAFGESPRAPRAGDQRRQTGSDPRTRAPCTRVVAGKACAPSSSAPAPAARHTWTQAACPDHAALLRRRSGLLHLPLCPRVSRGGLPGATPQRRLSSLERSPSHLHRHVIPALATPRNRDRSPALPSSGTPPASARRPCAAARPDPARGRRRSGLPLAAKRSYCASASTNAGWTGVSFTQEDTWSRGGRGSGGVASGD